MTDLEQDIRAIWEDILDISPIDLHDNFFDLGGHSLLAVRLFAEIRKRAGYNLPLVTLFRAPTIKRLVAVISRSDPTEPFSPIVPIGAQSAGAGWFIVHGLTGLVLNLRELGLRLGRRRPVYAVQARGVDGAEPPFDRIEDMAAYYIDHVRRVQPRGPYLLAGFCFGGVVAFEMAQQLSRSGQEVAFLGLLDSFFHYRFLSPLGRLRFQLAKQLIHARTLRQLSGRERLAYMRAKLAPRLARLAPAKAPRARVSYLEYLPDAQDIPAELRGVTAAAERAFYHYEPRVYPGRLSYVQPMVRDFRNILDFSAEWRRKAAGGVDTVYVPGDHSLMLNAPAVDVMADLLHEHVDRIGARD